MAGEGPYFFKTNHGDATLILSSFYPALKTEIGF